MLLLDRPISVSEKTEAEICNCENGKIILDGISFSYKEKSQKILESFNLTIKPNECLAIVGETGSGKTTIINLISRLYDVQQGRVKIDDQDVKEVTLSSLRQKIGVVMQEPVLHSESIRYNLCYGVNEEMNNEYLNSILKIVGADFVFDLPDGLDTLVGERGARLSLGQRQLIAFARALVPNPKILLLDEATSSIDPQAELKIQRAMSKMLKDRTSIIVAHRLSTVRKADRIIVLNNGQIKEEGTLNELIKLKGRFYNLYKLQFNGNNSKS